ncbi:MAG: hypothetical protein HQK54_03135 [Oligoflexales bacterium]|nr:hypothetical protein [Oligoflexales bacterium]
MVKEIPKWLKRYLDSEGAARIQKAVEKAEKRTSGEIVPMVVSRSTVNSCVPFMYMIIFSLLVLALNHAFSVFSVAKSDEFVWSALFIAMAASGWGVGHLSYFQRILVPKVDQVAEVRRRAMLAFHELDMKSTRGGTGILLFISLFERQAVVLADKGISQHYDKDIFCDVAGDLIEGAKRRDLAQGFENAIDRCAGLLEPHFPCALDDQNELKDHLRIHF